MKENRGQITIFIIISILILAVVVLFFTFRGKIGKEKPLSPETSEIQNFVQECLDESLERVVFRIGENGGYYSLDKTASTSILEAPYYIKNNRSLMPSKEKIQNEISGGVARELIFCINNFASFPEYEITKGKMAYPEVIIEAERVLVDINYPLTIIKGDSKFKLKNFNSEIPVKLGIIYDAVEEFINQSINTNGFCISCLGDIQGKYKIFIDGHYSEETKDIVFIAVNEDEYFEQNEDVFKYVFAIEQK